ncbi:zinc finger A20 and AN1 domain-containing stress-associated protein 6 [Caerostris extrusa]|uniref:Zinc finger A20 and AN1 domain-containing stress-associated protein 6 n=1 Tax=Caerostris extrusa TaxID=172846 RepID=A0AAV4VVC1_CAEEX|nr:zinc finger A20 and AN1 domain-containing stress-associated protein 6 [Caerostris extrusa]
MSDEEKKSDLDAKIVSSTVNNMLSVLDRNDAVHDISAGYEADQSSVQDISNVNSPRIFHKKTMETENHTCNRNSSKPGKITFARESSLEITGKKNENNVKDDSKNLRSALKPIRRLPKYKDVKNETTSETNPTDFKGHLIQESSSEGTLADVEDNIDSTSNGDISYNLEKGHDGTKTIPESSGGQSSKTISALAPSVDISKESSTRIPIKSASMPLKKNSNLNTSQLPCSEKKMASSSTSQLKIKSDVARHTKRKCFVCNKKLGLTAITCRCGGLYCSQHRYDKEHNCTFDYRSLGAEEIRKNNPLIVAEKIPKL